jgi:RimJ/RimL family protein N-acetyltransferase
MEHQAGLLQQAAIWHGQDAMRADSIALGVVDVEGRLQAVVTIDNQCAHSCDFHIASNGGRRWATRGVLRVLGAYAFDHLGVTKIKTVVPHWNIRALTACLHIGWRIEGATKCGAHDGTDGVCFGMTRDECRWLEKD